MQQPQQFSFQHPTLTPRLAHPNTLLLTNTTHCYSCKGDFCSQVTVLSDRDGVNTISNKKENEIVQGIVLVGAEDPRLPQTQL
jgi:hypothetical protein